MKKKTEIRKKALELFRKGGGILKTFEATQHGIYDRLLKELLKEGLIEKCQRGLYVLKDFEGIEQPDYAILSKKIPRGVICFLSALYFHNLIVQVPKLIDIALVRSCKPQKINHPPVKYHWYSKQHHELGIEKHLLGEIEIKVYSPEKTIVDCFRFPKKIPLSISIEALKTAYYEKKLDINKLMKFAEIRRILKTIKPYLTMLTHDQS